MGQLGKSLLHHTDLQPLQADTHHDAGVADEQVQGSAALVEAVSKLANAPQGPQVQRCHLHMPRLGLAQRCKLLDGLQAACAEANLPFGGSGCGLPRGNSQHCQLLVGLQAACAQVGLWCCEGSGCSPPRHRSGQCSLLIGLQAACAQVSLWSCEGSVCSLPRVCSQHFQLLQRGDLAVQRTAKGPLAGESRICLHCHVHLSIDSTIVMEQLIDSASGGNHKPPLLD